MTVLQAKIKAKQQAMAKMLAQPSYYSAKFDKLLKECQKLQALNANVNE